MQDLYARNYQRLLRKTKEYVKKWRDIPCSWIRRLNLYVSSKLICIFNMIPVKIP